ncbi:MAG: LysR substrate-binding domain-containing protein, partial [Verrucomicrobiia bacterium]
SVVPLATVSQEVISGQLVAIEFDEPDMYRPIGVITKRGRAVTPAHRRFVELLKDESNTLARFGEATSVREPLAQQNRVAAPRAKPPKGSHAVPRTKPGKELR